MARSTARTSGSRTSGGAPPAAKKTATKKTAAKKAPAKKAPAKRAAAKKTAPGKPPPKEAPRSVGRSSASQMALRAAAQLLDLTGKEAEGVVGVDRNDAGWVIQVETLELRRIPSTTDVLAIYEVTVDDDGELTGYRRLHRHVRGTPGED